MSKISKLTLSKKLTPQIAIVYAFLTESQTNIINSVSRLSINELDHYVDDDFNSIGTLLKHMAAVEYLYYVITFKNRLLNDNELSFWNGAIQGQLIHRLIKNNPVEYYIHLWRNIRKHVYRELILQNDDWLKSSNQFGTNLFCWNHVIEDHICHFGQIKTIKKKLSKN